MLAAVGHKCRVTRIWRGGRRGSLIRAGLSGRQNARVDSDTWQEFERKFKCSVLYLEAVIYTLPFAVLYLNQSASATHHNGMWFFYYFFFLVYLYAKNWNLGYSGLTVAPPADGNRLNQAGFRPARDGVDNLDEPEPGGSL